jgi:hypothetical protein
MTTSPKQYSWALLYLATITAEMIVVKHIFTTIEMTNWTRVFYNNILSLLFQPFFFYITNESRMLPDLNFTISAGVYLVLSCILGTALAWSGTALRERISATSFTVVGVSCKVVTEVINFAIWDKHANSQGLVALATCFVGSLMFVPSTTRDDQSTISNTVWSALNKVTCGLLKYAELEGPDFHTGRQDPAYAPVVAKIVEIEASVKDDVEIGEKIEPK